MTATDAPLVVPVCFAADFAPDLAEVAAATGGTADSVVAALCAAPLVVARLGFLPGFPYMAGVPAALHLPRRAVPRARVPAGSVAIATDQAGIYPCESPGGWHLVGRTPLLLFDLFRDPPALLAPGQRVQLQAIPPATFAALAEARRPAPPPVEPSDGALQVLAPGLLTTVEDAGRDGHAALGVAPGGAFDRAALRLANALVGNPATAAVLECAGTGPVLVPDRDVVVALVGAPFAAQVNDRPLPPGCAVRLRAGDRLALGAARDGCRAWLAVGGGLAVPPVLGSRSTHRLAGFGGFHGRALRTGDLLPLGVEGAAARECRARLAAGDGRGRRMLAQRFEPTRRLRYRPAAGSPELPAQAWQVAPASDRMGLRLAGAPLPTPPDAGTRPSIPVTRGTIQLPPDGRPIILGADHQLTGGYPVLGTVLAADEGALAQCRAGDTLVLHPVTPAEADAADQLYAATLARSCAALAAGAVP